MNNEVGYFNNLNKYANMILSSLVQSDEVAKILTYTEPDMLRKPAPEDRYGLIYKNVFPYGYVPDVEKDTEAYIAVEFDQFRSVKGNYFVSGMVAVSIFVHDRLQKTDSGNRGLLLNDEVHKVLQGMDVGIGKLNLKFGGVLKGIRRPYSGHYFAYELTDFKG